MDDRRMRIEQARRIAKLEKDIKKQTLRLIPSIYACIAKSMFDNGIDVDQIAKIIADTQDLWEQSNENIDPMIEWVADTTGLELRGSEWIG